MSPTFLIVVALAALALPIQAARGSATSAIVSSAIQANANHVPAGKLENGVLVSWDLWICIISKLQNTSNAKWLDSAASTTTFFFSSQDESASALFLEICN